MNMDIFKYLLKKRKMNKHNFYKYMFLILVVALSLSTTSCGNKQNSKKETTESHDHDDDHEHSSDENHDHEKDHDHDHTEGDNHDHKAVSEKHGHGEEDIIVVTPEQEKMLGVEKLKITPDTFYQVIKCSGEILPAQGDEKTIVSTTSGIVNFSKQGISEGMTVKSGEVLFSINSKNIGEGDMSLKAKNLYEREKKEFERAKELIAYKLISEKEFNEIQMNYENAKLSYNVLHTNSVGGGVGVSSPLSGFIKSVMVSDGQYVSTGEPLAIVTQSNKLQLRANVSQKYYSNLANIASANIVLPYNQESYKLSDLNGKVLSYGKSVEKNDFYMPVNFSFDNVGSIIPGSIVQVYLLGNPKTNSKVVPLTSLLEVQGNYFVIVNLHDDEFQERRVTVGESDGANIEILDGLSFDEVVVSKGGYLVKQAKSSTAIPDGHNH